MDYEQKYKAALGWMQSVYPTMTGADKEDAGHFFPELKESEDERMVKFIKKQLFNIKKTITENYELDAKLTKAIDWLKKQGEQKPAWSEEDERMLHTIIADFKGFIRNNTSTLESHFNECIDWLKSIKNRVQPEQEWSEEDEVGLDDALWAIEQARTIAKDENDMGNLWYAEKWLKTIKKRMEE